MIPFALLPSPEVKIFVNLITILDSMFFYKCKAHCVLMLFVCVFVVVVSGFSLNPLSPNSDKNEISLYMYVITTCSNIQGTRIKETVTKDEMS